MSDVLKQSRLPKTETSEKAWHSKLGRMDISLLLQRKVALLRKVGYAYNTLRFTLTGRIDLKEDIA